MNDRELLEAVAQRVGMQAEVYCLAGTWRIYIRVGNGRGTPREFDVREDAESAAIADLRALARAVREVEEEEGGEDG